MASRPWQRGPQLKVGKFRPEGRGQPAAPFFIVLG